MLEINESKALEIVTTWLPDAHISISYLTINEGLAGEGSVQR